MDKEFLTLHISEVECQEYLKQMKHTKKNYLVVDLWSAKESKAQFQGNNQMERIREDYVVSDTQVADWFQERNESLPISGRERNK